MVYKVNRNTSFEYLGYIIDPYLCCNYSLIVQIFNKNGLQINDVVGDCCQLGVLCNQYPFDACQTVKFNIYESSTKQILVPLLKVKKFIFFKLKLILNFSFFSYLVISKLFKSAYLWRYNKLQSIISSKYRIRIETSHFICSFVYKIFNFYTFNLSKNILIILDF
jgi:hypothetical protein